MIMNLTYCFVFFFNDTATTEIYTLSLHDALPIFLRAGDHRGGGLHQDPGRGPLPARRAQHRPAQRRDRKSTRLNSSHANISYAVFCLKKKKKLKQYIIDITKLFIRMIIDTKLTSS